MREAAGRKQFLNKFVQWISSNMIKTPEAEKATRPNETFLS